MSSELNVYTISLQRLDQKIETLIVTGEGGVRGAKLRVVISQKAAERLTPSTRLYLNWNHGQTKIKGYSVFTKMQDNPAVFDLIYPSSMLVEGQVQCRLELVDDISISPGVDFFIHVLQTPSDGSSFIESDDYSDFQSAVVEINSLSDSIKNELDYQQKRFGNLKLKTEEALEAADDAKSIAQEALDKANSVIGGEDLNNLKQDIIDNYIGDTTSSQGERLLVTDYVQSLLTITSF